MLARPNGRGAALPAALRLGIRPEHLIVREEEPGGLAARIQGSEAMGRETMYTADTDLGMLRFLETTPLPRFRPGDKVRLGFEPSHALLFDRASGRRVEGLEIHV
ncbi:TOBE domain-containing protein [Nitratireductor thuwali]|uniref:Transport-associated OB type 2 domain-containing protein n=1 Tax=Nitratireductor thuwali TaxID=2267699 RepID=A0ABY5MC14_9HYPH|nr:hypothetical protein NTH_00087 [Nitratireductor thuwali]